MMIPGLQTLMDELQRGQGPSVRVGIAGIVQVIDPLSGSRAEMMDDVDGPACDRFKLILPYGGKTIKCEIVFFGNSVDYPPDVLFEDKSFTPNLFEIDSFTNWLPQNKPDALLRLVSQLMSSYGKHQLKLLEEKYPLLHSQYVLLLEQPQFPKENVQVRIAQEKEKGSANILVVLPLAYMNIPPFSIEGNPGENSAVLLACFPSSAKAKTITQLFLSPGIEKLFGIPGSTKLRLAPYRLGDYVNYVMSVCETLQEKIGEIVGDFDKKKAYFASFLSYFGRSLLECDYVQLSYLAFLLEWKSFFFVLHIKIPEEFPNRCPVIVFQSTFGSRRQPVFTVECKKYPYSSHWSGDLMAERARSYIQDYVPEFKKQYNIQNP